MAENAQKILISGVKPTGKPHLGNYFGAMRQFVALQREYRSFFFIADYHALTSLNEADALRSNIREVALDYLSIGLDPKHVTLFQQSAVPAHTELAWIFNCLTTMPYLMRAHAYKDAQAKDKDISVGTFSYPLLMSADILLYDADIVPVGLDQKQHIEYARDTAQKFNRLFKEIFTLPEAHIMKDVATIPGTDGQKMSKSYNNTIPLFATLDEIQDAVMSIVTDSKGERPEHVFALHKLIKDAGELEALYEENKGNYRALKEALILDIESLIKPLREKRNELEKDTAFVESVLREGGEVARERSEKKMKEVRKSIGVSL